MKNYRKFIGVLLLFSTLILGCGSSDNDTSNGGNNFSSTLDVGESANDFLASESYTSLAIEIDYVEGYRPTQTALNRLSEFLEARLNKPGGISITVDDEIPSPGSSPYTAQEAFNLEKEHRNNYTEGNTIAAYFIVLDGEFEQENVLGFAYFNTSMALMGETIEQSSGGLNQPDRDIVETAVLEHEFGHILGLVDNGTPAIQDHVDEANGAHCDVESCLMYFAVRTSDFMNNLTGGNIPDLDAQCIQDLQANGGK